jgi:PAS domain S-box-containing protein
MKYHQFISFFEFVDEGIFVFGSDWRLLYSNRAFFELTGYAAPVTPDALLLILHVAEADQDIISSMREAVENGHSFAAEIVGRKQSGDPFWSDFAFRPEHDENGALCFFIGKFRDLSHVKAMENKAQQLERDYRFIFENVQSAITVHGFDAQIRVANPRAIELLGLDLEALQGRSPNDQLFRLFRENGSEMPPEEVPVIRAITERNPVRGVVLGYHRESDHKRLWFVCNAFPVLDEAGMTQEVVLSFSDITPLIESQAQARLFKERFELAARATQDVIFEWDIETGHFWANEAYKTVYGYEPPNYMSLEDLPNISGAKADHRMVQKVTKDAIKSSKQRYLLDYGITRPDGTFGQIAVRAFIVRDAHGNAQKIIGTGTDVGQLSRANYALEQSEARFRLIADSASDVLWDHDFEQNVTWSSPDWPTKLGIDVDPTFAQEFKWLEIVDQLDRQRLRESFQNAIKSTTGSWDIEFKAYRGDGQPIILAVKASILRNAAGRAVRILGNMRNVTAEKRTQEGYTRARALEAVGQLTGGFAHDFNNLLMIIQGNAELLELSNLDDDSAESVSLINEAAASAAKLTRRLLTFAGQTKLDTRRVDMATVIEGTMALLRSGLPATVKLRHSIAEGIWAPIIDANALQQAIVNLAMNSHDAMPSGGEITVTCENHEIATDMLPPTPQLNPGRYVLLAVSDNGEGMARDVLSRAFEPFFTTKDVGKGTGLGLSTVFGFAHQSGGGVTIYSEEGYGTTVNLYLPVQDAAAVPTEHDDPVTERSAKSGLHILVVEDQPQVRSHVVRALRRFGYKVEATEDAASALRVLEHKPDFDLLFTDIVMPGGMNGQALGEAAKQLRPSIKVLYTSGYPAAAFEHLGLKQQSNVNLLHKPYRTVELQEAIDRALRGD